MKKSISRRVGLVVALGIALTGPLAFAGDNNAAPPTRPAPRAGLAPRADVDAPAAAPAAPPARGTATYYRAIPPRHPNPLPNKPAIQHPSWASPAEAKLSPRDIAPDRPPVSTEKQKLSPPHVNSKQLATTGTQEGNEAGGNWSHNNRSGRSTLDRQSAARLRDWRGKRDSVTAACAKHRDHGQHHHNREWWWHHCNVIVLVGWGYWGWDAGWWYPAWGYNPFYSTYAFDGPIYGYQDLPPDQIIANVQGALQDLGYYLDEIDGVLGSTTRAALESFQQDNGLPVTGLIGPETLQALGFI
jgi:Putative peptidoglycan binding domain